MPGRIAAKREERIHWRDGFPFKKSSIGMLLFASKYKIIFINLDCFPFISLTGIAIAGEIIILCLVFIDYVKYLLTNKL